MSNASRIYRDPATDSLYRVSPKPYGGKTGCYVIEINQPHDTGWRPCVTWSIGNIYKDSLAEVLDARAKREGWALVDSRDPCDTCRCPSCADPGCPQAHCDKADHGLGCMAPDEDCPPEHNGGGTCQDQNAQSMDAAATTAARAVTLPQTAATRTGQTDASTLQDHDCPADAGAATQSQSAADTVSLAAEQPDTPFDYSGLGSQTVAVLQSAEQIIRNARKDYVVKVADAVGMAHDELCGTVVHLVDNGQFGKKEETFRAWCASVGIGRTTAYKLLQVSNLLSSSSPNEAAVLKQASPSLLYAAAKPTAPAALVEQVKAGDITTNKQYQDLLAAYQAEQRRSQSLAEKAKAADKAAKAAQEQAKMLEGAEQVMTAAKMRADKYKAELDALKAQPIESPHLDTAELDKLAAEKAQALLAQMQADAAPEDEMAMHNAYDAVIYATRAMTATWQAVQPQLCKLPPKQRAGAIRQLTSTLTTINTEVEQCL